MSSSDAPRVELVLQTPKGGVLRVPTDRVDIHDHPDLIQDRTSRRISTGTPDVHCYLSYETLKRIQRWALMELEDYGKST